MRSPTESDSAPNRGQAFFRVPPALLRALPGIAKRGGLLKPKRDIFVLLAAHAQAAHAPLRECELSDVADIDSPWIMFPFREAELLSALGFKRCGADFSGSAWSLVRESLLRLECADVNFRQALWRGKRVEEARFRDELLRREERSRLLLRPYAAPQSRYYVLVPRAFLTLRPSLGELATRMLCWLLVLHRGRRVDGRLQHRWKLTITPEMLVDAELLPFARLRHAVELRRAMRALVELEYVGVLRRKPGATWPVQVELSESFFHKEDARG